MKSSGPECPPSGRRLFIDIGPLRRSRDFRYLYIGEAVSLMGSGLTFVTVPFQLFRLTHSSFQVGAASLVQLFPLVLLSTVGGAIADAHDRRRVLLVVEAALAACSCALALNSTLGHHPSVWPLYVFSAAASGLSGIESPARVSAASSVLDRSDLTRMSALWQVLFQTSVVVGPLLAGVVIAFAGTGTAYWVDAATFIVVFLGVFLMRPMPAAPGVSRAGLSSVIEGFRHLKSDVALQGIYLIDLGAMVFGMPKALFPALGTVVFHGGARTVSYFYSSLAVGGVVGALTTGWASHVRRQGRAVVFAVLIWGAAIAGFGFVRSLPVALVMLAFAGWADVVSAIFRNSVLQLRTPDRLRGRMNAIQVAVVSGGPRLGDLESGAVASATSLEVSIVSGGLACIVTVALLLAKRPGFWRLDVGDTTQGDFEADAALEGSLHPAAFPDPAQTIVPSEP